MKRPLLSITQLLAALSFALDSSASPLTGTTTVPVTLSPTSVTFPNQFVGNASGSQTLTLTNAQTVPLTISRIAISGGNAPGDFSFGGFCPISPNTLGAGLTCTINVRFEPSALGSRTAALTVTDNASSSPQSTALTGTGIAPVTVSPTSLTFAGQNVGTKSAAQTVVLANHLKSAVPVSSVTTSGDFAVASNTCGSSVGAGVQCSVGVTFTPTAAGPRSGTLSISDSAFGSPNLIKLNGTGDTGQTWGNIQHVIVIFQENRSTDNLFHDSVLMARGADIASSGLNSSGATIQLTASPMVTDYDLGHYHQSFIDMYDKGKMDGADKIKPICQPTATDCPPPHPQFTYVQASDVGPYFQLAEQYTFGDRMFQTNQGPSFPAHQFIISGTSAPTEISNLFASSNPTQGNGCIAPAASRVALADPTGKDSSSMYPCFEHATLSDELDAKGLSWRYYTPSPVSLWTGPNAIEHMCQPQTQNGQLVCTGSIWSHVIIAPPQVLTDITTNHLPAVSWVMPDGRASDHTGTTDGSGPSWVASIVNAVGTSSYWANTAIVITWDDWGGFYDHVPPPIINDGISWGSGYVYGFRVPLIVVSPYAKPGYISHVTHDFGSILNLIENVFSLPSLGYADARADDLSDCFNFNQTPLKFQKIASPLTAEHFLNDRRPPTDPDDD